MLPLSSMTPVNMCRVTRKLLKEAQHQVALMANENRQLNGIREQGIMPAWSSGLLEQSLVQFKDVQVSPPASSMHLVCHASVICALKRPGKSPTYFHEGKAGGMQRLVSAASLLCVKLLCSLKMR